MGCLGSLLKFFISKVLVGKYRSYINNDLGRHFVFVV